LRFTLSAMAAQGRDIKLSPQRVEGYRNFATKLWNAARFAEMNECVRQPDFDPAGVEETLNRWIAGETERAARAVTAAIEGYRFNEAAAAVYEFVWGVFCDWYLELIKPILTGEDEAANAETLATAAWVLDQILKSAPIHAVHHRGAGGRRSILASSAAMLALANERGWRRR
jgi:valyl-tRNA synthetase